VRPETGADAATSRHCEAPELLVLTNLLRGAGQATEVESGVVMAANESVVVDVEDLGGRVGPQLWRKAHYQLVATFLDVKLWQDEGQRDIGPEGAGGKRGNVFDRPPQSSRFGDLRVEPEGPRWRLIPEGAPPVKRRRLEESARFRGSSPA
jgi:hypothetical protein